MKVRDGVLGCLLLIGGSAWISRGPAELPRASAPLRLQGGCDAPALAVRVPAAKRQAPDETSDRFEAAAEMAVATGSAEGRAAALQVALYAWTAQDSAAAIDWVARRLSGEERDHWVLQMASWELHSDLPTAAGLVEALPEGQARVDLSAGIVRRWAQDDPAAAKQWIEKLQSAPLQIRLAQELALAGEAEGAP